MKTKISILIIFLAVLTLSACKKDYTCKAVAASGEEMNFKCENCSKKDAEAYEKSILDAGYTTAECTK